MTCLICDSNDREISCVGQFWVRKCEDCGVYGLPGELAEAVQEEGKRFDVVRTRAFLSGRSKDQEAPWITAEDVQTHQLIKF